MSKRKSSKGKVFFGLLIFVIILLGIWYFLGMPGLHGWTDPKKISSEVTAFVKNDIHVSDFLEQQKNTVEKVKEDLKHAVSDATESVQKVIKKEYSSADCDLNHSENSPLFFGNPSDCIEDLASAHNYLLEKTQFTISYNNETLCPNWVGWHLAVTDLGEADRSNKFAPDKSLPAEWHQVSKNDYQFNAYGFDRGHICPSADRTASQLDNEITFLMTNMVPQAPDCNRIVWMHLENYERQLANEGNELYIFAGPYGTGGVGQKGEFDEIPVTTKGGQTLKINVPAYTWKIILILSDGEEDFARVTENTEVLAVCVPNAQGCNKAGDWDQYLCTVDYIEELTGYDFFELLPDTVEDVLEAKVYKM